MKDNIVTTDRLIAFLDELRCCKHYIFAMLKDADLTDFYICGRSSGGGDAIADDMTLAQFLARSRNFKPDDVFTVYFDIRLFVTPQAHDEKYKEDGIRYIYIRKNKWSLK